MDWTAEGSKWICVRREFVKVIVGVGCCQWVRWETWPGA